MIEILVDADEPDGQKVRLWARGTYPAAEFWRACEDTLKAWGASVTVLSGNEVLLAHWRSIQEPVPLGQGKFSSRTMRVLAKRSGHGAYAVTYLKDSLIMPQRADRST